MLKNDLELGDLWRLRDADFRQMGIHSMGIRRNLLGAARRLRSLYLKPAPGGFAEWMESQVGHLSSFCCEALPAFAFAFPCACVAAEHACLHRVWRTTYKCSHSTKSTSMCSTRWTTTH